MNEKIPRSLYEVVKRKVDLAEFLQTEIGCNIKWYEPNISGGVVCPMPHHKDNKPSFRIKFINEDGVWIYNCLGCGSKGTIIDFFVDYYNLNNSAEAVIKICKKFDIKNEENLTINIKDIKKKSDLKKKMEYQNILTSNTCRMLLRKDYKKHSKWVGCAYRKLNESLLKEDISVIEKIGSEAAKKMGE